MSDLIRRSKKTNRFTQIDNKLINDVDLSADSMGILIYILSKPDDWVAQKWELRKRFKIGRQRMDGIFKELISLGYVFETELIRDHGMFAGKGYVFYDERQVSEQPMPDNRCRETDNGQPTPVTRQHTNIPSSKKESQIPSQDFQAFWDGYQKKVGSKPKTEKAWKKLKPEEQQLILDGLDKYVRSQTNKQYQPYPLTFLNERRWENEDEWGENAWKLLEGKGSIGAAAPRPLRPNEKLLPNGTIVTINPNDNGSTDMEFPSTY